LTPGCAESITIRASSLRQHHRRGRQGAEESRFVYTPPRPGLSVALARLWIARGKIAAVIAGLIGAVGLGLTAYYFLVERPAAWRSSARRSNLRRPAEALDAAYAGIIAEAKTPAARPKADQLLADGKSALARETPPAPSRARRLQQLPRIWGKPISGDRGATGRVERLSASRRNTEARIILIVERSGPTASAALPITSEETAAQNGHKWASGGPEDVHSIAATGGRRHHPDRKVGEKLRGALDVDYSIRPPARRYPVVTA